MWWMPSSGGTSHVSAAIKAAKPGDRILVRPGLYEEGLVVDKPLEILGDGPVSDIEIRARDADVLGSRPVRPGGEPDAAPGRRQGELVWRRYHPGAAGAGRLRHQQPELACVVIRDGADPRLRRNRIHDSKKGGVLVFDSGLGTLEDNDITGNALSGVAIRTGGNPAVRGNRIHDDKQSGVYVDKGQGKLEDNDITGNALSGRDGPDRRQPHPAPQPDPRQQASRRLRLLTAGWARWRTTTSPATPSRAWRSMTGGKPDRARQPDQPQRILRGVDIWWWPRRDRG